jgi:hypothetical protein
MAWIESHQSLKDHHKTMVLERELHISTVRAIGHLHLLWWWCLDNASDGNLESFDPRDIAKAAQWTGDSDKFLNALITAGFIDEKTTQTENMGVKKQVTLHDWYDYAGKLVERRNANKDRMRDYRATHVQRTFNARATATVPNPTVHNPIYKEIVKKDVTKPVKENYGSFKNVLLTSEEYEKLKVKFNSHIEEMIERLSEGIASKGYKYKNHYAAILTWERMSKERGNGKSTGVDRSNFKPLPPRDQYTQPYKPGGNSQTGTGTTSTAERTD